MTNKEMYDIRWKRVTDALSLTEPDTVPLAPVVQCYPYLQAGYTMAEILYDTTLEKMKDSLFKFVDKYQPDYLFGQDYVDAGQGPSMELSGTKTIRWAGMPGNVIDDNSIHQFIEFPVLEDDEYEEYFSDRAAWILNKGLPRTSSIFEPFRNFPVKDFGLFNGAGMIAPFLTNPEFKEMQAKLEKIQALNAENRQRLAQVNAEIEERGFPTPMKGMAAVPFDGYSDFLRGTIDGLSDLYVHTEEVQAYIDEEMDKQLAFIKMQGQMIPGRCVFMALHKGMDGFMSDVHYRTFYWDYLQRIIYAIIDNGMIPYIYTEGKYDSRLECLKEVPRGKVIYHFEDVDMAEAKKVLGDTACISGGFPVYLLDYGTKEQVVDECKRLIDICAPGGGFIFETCYGMDYAKPENVEAMADTVRTYGKR